MLVKCFENSWLIDSSAYACTRIRCRIIVMSHMNKAFMSRMNKSVVFHMNTYSLQKNPLSMAIMHASKYSVCVVNFILWHVIFYLNPSCACRWLISFSSLSLFFFLSRRLSFSLCVCGMHTHIHIYTHGRLVLLQETEQVQSHLQRKISQRPTPPNADSTLRRSAPALRWPASDLTDTCAWPSTCRRWPIGSSGRFETIECLEQFFVFNAK